jgi:glycosyltransferase involved in cell wall biosynthesis
MIRKVVYFLGSAEFGGTEQALLHILAGLDRTLWQPVLFHHPEPGLIRLVERAKSLDVRLQEVPRVQSRRSLAQWLPRFVQELRAERPAIFHAQLNYQLACKDGLIAAILARVPAVIATVQLFVEAPLGSFIRGQQRLLSAAVDRYIAVSHDVAARLRQILHIPDRKIEVVHNAIPLGPLNRPTNGTLRAALTGPIDRPIVLTPARLCLQKGHSYLLQAAALVPEALFVIAGDGPERANLEAQAAEHGLSSRVRFLGYRQDIPDLLACCNLFVLPSLFEGFPLSILEAMAAGKPVIASAIGGNDEVITHGENGLLVPPADPAALAGAIRTVLLDPTLARRLAEDGRARVQQEFSVEAMVDGVTRVYEELTLGRAEQGQASST